MINYLNLVINEPRWGILVSFYYFLLAISSGTMIVALLPGFLGNPITDKVFKKASYVSLIALLIVPIVLIAKLLQPMRFIFLFNPMYFNPLSPLAWGGLLLTAYGAVLVFFMYQRGWIGIKQSQTAMRETVAAGESGISGIPLGLFFLGLAVALLPPAELIVVHGKAFWRGDLLPVYFFTSILAGAAVLAALLSIYEEEANIRFYTNIMIISITLSVFWIILRSISLTTGGTEEVLALKKWWSNSVFLTGEVLLGLIVPFVLLVRGGTKYVSVRIIIASVLAIVGVFAMRYVVIAIGTTAILP